MDDVAGSVEVFTVGHSTHLLDAFEHMLEANGIRHLIDELIEHARVVPADGRRLRGR